MCGLNLLLNNGLSVHAMNDAIRHRGTDFPQVLRGPTFQLGHVRLPIVGLSPRYDQPFRKGGWTFAFVGEIVNFKELDRSAESDIEVLADQWMEHGPSCVKRFDGFWSFVAIHEDKPHEAHIVVDFLAKKPLYMIQRGATIAVSSEIKAIGQVLKLQPDPLYFSSVRKWGYSASPRTWAQGVRKLPAGSHTVIRAWGEWDGNHLVTTRNLDTIEPDPNVDLRRAIVTAVERRVLSSDVPISILLSGGLDSSIIYQLARGLRKDITIYHAENDERRFLDLLEPDENVVEVDFSGGCIKDILRTNEGPVDPGSMLQQYHLGRAVQESVCLSGDGADELFGGYRRAQEYDSQYSDVFEELVYYHLPRLDKMMMAGTVELRSPFLAREVVAGALALPRDVRTSKQWLRTAFSDILPREIVEAPKRPLKSPQVLKDPILWRNQLCDAFLKMIERGEV